MIEIEAGVIGAFIFLVLRTCRWIQRFIADMFWLLFVKPVLLLTKLVGIKKNISVQNEISLFVTLDTRLPVHRILLKYLEILFQMNTMLSGVVSDRVVYSRLLSWNSQIPIIGFKSDKTTFVIELLLEKEFQGNRTVDLMFLTSHQEKGVFKIISREFSSGKNEEVIIRCLWITGSDKGKAFEISRYFPKDLMILHKEKPLSAVYYPPQFVIFIFKVFISASAVIAFLELTKDIWKIIGAAMFQMGIKISNSIFDFLH